MKTLGAFAGREVRRQLARPVSWLIVALFALIAGVALVTNLNAFLEASIEALSAPPSRPINVNQLLIRPFIVQVGMAALFLLPLVTARACVTRRVRGSTEPPVNMSGVAGPLIGALSVYALMMATALALVLMLFLHGAPEWGPIASGYLGLLLIGLAFIAVALLISSLATTVLPAVAATLAVAFAIAAFTWLGRSAAADTRPVFRYLSVGAALDDFAKGVIDTGHVVTCLTIAALALFLTRLTLERDRSRKLRWPTGF